MIIMTIGLFVLAVVFTLDTVKSVIAGVKNEKPDDSERKTEAEKVIEESMGAMGP